MTAKAPGNKATNTSVRLSRRKAMLAFTGAALAGGAARAENCSPPAPDASRLCSTGALGVIIERAAGSVIIFDWVRRVPLERVAGFGDLSHASVVFSADARYAFVFGRDGGLTKLDLLTHKIAGRIVQAGNSIGGAISDDGQLVAVANYEPGGVKVFDTGTLAEVADIRAEWSGGRSKVVGLEDAPGRKFVFSLWNAGESWVADFSGGPVPAVIKLKGIGDKPYDALVSGDGRYYIAGLFGEDGLTVVDLWQAPLQSRRILKGYGQGETKLPVYKMPHLESWAEAGDRFALPAIGRHEVLWVDSRSFEEVARTKVHSQPVFAIARPDGRHVWVNFAHPANDTIQVLDSLSGAVIKEWKPGAAILHMEFTPRGNEVWVSVRDDNAVLCYDAHTFALKCRIEVASPSGIFLAARAHRLGL